MPEELHPQPHQVHREKRDWGQDPNTRQKNTTSSPLIILRAPAWKSHSAGRTASCIILRAFILFAVQCSAMHGNACTLQSAAAVRGGGFPAVDFHSTMKASAIPDSLHTSTPTYIPGFKKKTKKGGKATQNKKKLAPGI